jgi:hypothetical protein
VNGRDQAWDAGAALASPKSCGADRMSGVGIDYRYASLFARRRGGP